MEIKHYGTPRHSGRYPWGSGDDPQRSKSFLSYVDDLKKQGMSEVDIAKGLGLTTSQLRAKKSLEKDREKKEAIAEAIRLKSKGMSNTAIGEKMGLNESSVRALLKPMSQEKAQITQSTIDMLKKNIEDKKHLDVGVGTERFMGISRTKLKTAIEQMKEEGYTVNYIQVEQLGTGKKTSLMVLSAPGTKFTDVYKERANIKSITDYSNDGGRNFLGLKPIESVSSNRVQIRYAEDGGTQKDGVIELRRNVEDLSLGRSKYAQVRIGVDGTHYLKGMAMYSDNMPPGIDIIYNSNKPKGTPPKKVFKEMTDDPDNPFGATIKGGAIGQKRAINIVNEEGDWADWSKTISSQVLSKQSPSLAKNQLALAFNAKKEEYDEIMSLTNPAVKKKLLDSFADDADSAAVHLKGAALPRQASHAILPFPSIKENEIYAPNYRNGERVALIRYPHGGIFEIPELTVNNKNPEANRVIKGARDAVGINAKVAERLSGADFDGDTVLVIPNNNKLIKNSAPLQDLMNFDPKISYAGYEGMPVISPRTKQMKMGDVSNLITDMTIRGANNNEIARAVRHSMVVIDSEKHKLNYKQSYIDNGIAQLKQKYQGSSRSGASTLISRASSDTRVGVRKVQIDPSTGKKIYTYTGETYTNRQGKPVLKTVSSTKLYEVDDAFKLSSGTPIETVYATHANKLKNLANTARKASIQTKYTPYSPSAKQAYETEVKSLNSQLNIALRNAPLERQAQILANSIVNNKKAANPNMQADQIKKIKGQALAEARTRTGAKKTLIIINDNEWKAIQAGAIRTNNLTQILNNTDLSKIKQLATPRTAATLTDAKTAIAKNMFKSGYTQAEIAERLGVSTSLVSKVMQ